MSIKTIQAAYAAFANNDPSVLFGAMAPDVQWNEAQGNPLADRNPYVGAQAIDEDVIVHGRYTGSTASKATGLCRSSSTPTRRSGRG